jgi:hypothetical protein
MCRMSDLAKDALEIVLRSVDIPDRLQNGVLEELREYFSEHIVAFTGDEVVWQETIALPPMTATEQLTRFAALLDMQVTATADGCLLLKPKSGQSPPSEV